MPTDVLDNIRFDRDYVNEVLSFDIRRVETLSSLDISKYAMVLSQYLVYLRYNQNKIKTEIYTLKRYIDRVIALTMTSEVTKMYKTKLDAREYMIATNRKLDDASSKLEDLEKKQLLLDGVEKPVYELINCFKKEMSRRDNEYNMSYRS